MTKPALFCAAAACFAAAAAIQSGATPESATPGSPTPARLVRDIARPFLLPGLWSRLADPLVRDDPAEVVATLRIVAGLVPEWTDGTIDVAWREAVDLGREEATPELQARRLSTAERWLTDAADERSAERDGAQPAADLWLAAACLLTVRADQQPGIAAAYRRTRGVEPIERAAELTDLAVRAVDDAAIRTRAAHAAVRVVAAALRAGDVDRAQAMLDATLARLAALKDRASARRAHGALSRLPPLRTLVDEPSRLAEFRSDEDLAEIAAAIDALTTKDG